MEDFLSLVFFLIIAAISIISRLKKGGGETTSPSSGPASTLKEVIATIQSELNDTDTVMDHEDRSYADSAVLAKLMDETTLESYSGKKYRKTEQRPVKPLPVSPRNEFEKQNITPYDLRRIVIWKEILDKPVSMR